MGRDALTDPIFNHRKTPPMKFKSPFTSLTLFGVVISLLSKFAGVEVSSSEASAVMDTVKELWPLILGVSADVGAAYHRIRATNFNKELVYSRTFWLAIASGLCTIVSAFGYDVAGLQAIAEKGLSAWPALASLAGIAITIFGRWRAKHRLN